MDKENVREKIINWNVNFPIDRWWRKKHNIAFNSSAHREISFLDQLFEFEEDLLFNTIEHDDYIPNTGNWLKNDDITDEQFIEEARKEMENFPDLE